MSALFTPFRVGALELRNRIVIAPMCQYSAVDGCMTDWHVIHLGHLALSGAALLTFEATAVLPEARITYADVGLWNDATEAAIAYASATSNMRAREETRKLLLDFGCQSVGVVDDTSRGDVLLAFEHRSQQVQV